MAFTFRAFETFQSHFKMGTFVLLAVLAMSPLLLQGLPSDGIHELAKRSTTHAVSVNTTASHHSIDQKFLSVAIGARLCERLHKFKTGSVKLQNLARALSPASGRIGGTNGGFMIYQPPSGEAVPQEVIDDWLARFDKDDFNTAKIGKWYNRYCSADSYIKIANFFATVGWDLSLQMNHLLRLNGSWDTTNAGLLLDHLSANGVDLHEAQLTNEVNSYHIKFDGWSLPPSVVVGDFELLRDLLDDKGFEDTKILGPDVTSLYKNGPDAYLNATLTAGLGDYIDAITFHHFFMTKKEAKMNQFLNLTVDDKARVMMIKANAIRDYHGLDLPIYVTETASASGGGAKKLSNRYAGALSWVDSLGVVSLYKGSRMNRQTFWSGNYAFVEFKSFDPTPSFWVSVAFKRLIEGPVLRVAVSPAHDTLRVYANCARTDGTQYGAVPGDIVVYYVNVNTEATSIIFPDFSDKTYNLFLFKPPNKNSLKSIDIYLNDATSPLALDSNDNVTTVHPASQTGGTINIAGLGIGFIHVKDAQATVCL